MRRGHNAYEVARFNPTLGLILTRFGRLDSNRARMFQSYLRSNSDAGATLIYVLMLVFQSYLRSNSDFALCCPLDRMSFVSILP